MKTPLLATVAALAVLLSACGVTRGDDSADGTSTDVTTAVDDGVQADDDSSDETPSTTAPAPATTAPADDVAATVTLSDGEAIELLHGPLNDVVVPTRENQEFVDLIYQGQIPPGFDAVVLSQSILGEAIGRQLEAEGASVTDADQAEARQILDQQLSQVLIGSTDPESDVERLFAEVPYLRFIVDLQARQIALSNLLAAGAPDGEGVPCVRHILVETEGEGDDIQAELAAGADFGELAVERSTGPSGPSGGELGCADSAGYVPEFAAAVDGATVGEFVGPIQTQFGWHVLVVDGFEVDGDQLAQDRVTESLGAAEIDIDERVGTWDATRLAVVPAG
ncbi:MAG: peptidylprolyl isomerase [Actinomycetota bacterium]